MKQTYEQVAVQWKAAKRPYVKDTTYGIYVYHLNCHILPRFGEGAAPDEDQVQEWADDMLAKGLSVKTVRDALLVLKMVVNYGAKLKVWNREDYSLHLPQVAPSSDRLPVLPINHQKKLVTYLRNNITCQNLGILICLFSGMRIGEICGLQWRDIDLGQREVHVRKTVQRLWMKDEGKTYSGILVGSPKTLSSQRDIPITAEMMRILGPMKKQSKANYYVITDSTKPAEPRYYRDYFKKLLVKLNIPPVRFHALRHSFATRCIESNCDYKTVSAILGHASISTTMDLYVHPGHADKKRAIEKMARQLR